MFFINAFRATIATASNYTLNIWTGKTNPATNNSRAIANDSQQTLIENRVKAFVTMNEENFAALSDLHSDAIYGPMLRQVTEWLNQRGKIEKNDAKIPAWLRCDHCKFFFAGPFCLPCCNRIVCGHCMADLRRRLYESPDRLNRDRLVPDPTISCPNCEEPLHGTHIDSWNNSMKQLLYRVTIRHNMEGAHDLTLRGHRDGCALNEEGSEGESNSSMPPCSLMGNKILGKPESPLACGTELDVSSNCPNSSASTTVSMEPNIFVNSMPLDTSKINKNSAVDEMSINQQPKSTDSNVDWWKNLPIIKYDTRFMFSADFTPQSDPLKLNPAMQPSNTEFHSQDPKAKRSCIERSAPITISDLGSHDMEAPTTALALGALKFHPLVSNILTHTVVHEDTGSLDIDEELDSDFRVLAPDFKNHGVRNDDTLPNLDNAINLSNGELQKGHNSFFLEEDIEQNLSLTDFEETQSEYEHANTNSNTNFFKQEWLSCDYTASNTESINPLTSTSPISPDSIQDTGTTSPTPQPRKIHTLTPEKQTKPIHGLLTPPNSTTIPNRIPQSWNTTISPPISILNLPKTTSATIAPPLAIPTLQEHTTYTGNSVLLFSETSNYFNLEEQVNDRLIYKRTLNIQLSLLSSSEFGFGEGSFGGGGVEEVSGGEGEEISGGVEEEGGLDLEIGVRGEGELSRRTREVLGMGMGKLGSVKKSRGVLGRPVWRV